MSVRTIVRNGLLASLVPAAAAIALFAGPAQAQATHNPPGYAAPTTAADAHPTTPADARDHNPPGDAHPTAPADTRVDHNPPGY